MTPFYLAHQRLFLNLDDICFIKVDEAEDTESGDSVPLLTVYQSGDAEGEVPLELCRHDSAELRAYLVGLLPQKQQRDHFMLRPLGKR